MISWWPDERVALADAGDRAGDDVGLGAVVADEIQVDGRQAGERPAWLRASATAFRKTSGSTTADPQFR